MFLQHYPYALLIEFCLLIISLCCYTFDFGLVICTKGYRLFAIRLFLYMIVAQLCILIPQFIIPFLVNSGGNPSDKSTIIGNIACQFQGAAILFGWISAALLSVYMQYCVYEVINGRRPRRHLLQEVLWIGGIFIVSLVPNIVFFYFEQFELYGWHYAHNDQMNINYVYCQLRRGTLSLVLLILEDLFLVGLTTFFYLKIRTKRQQLISCGIVLIHPILDVHKFAFAQLLMWSINAIVKALDAYDKYSGQRLGPFWVFLNLIYYFEAFCIKLIFLHFYLPYLRNEMNIYVYKVMFFLTHCCSPPPKQESLLHSIITESQSEDMFQYTDLSTSSKREASRKGTLTEG